MALEPTGAFERAELLRLLRRACEGHAFSSDDPENPEAVAQEMLSWQWEHRWPRWPRWLDRLPQGDTAPM